MNDKPNFASILDEAPTEIDRPKPIPTGTYLCRVQGTPTYDKSSGAVEQSSIPYLKYVIRGVNPYKLGLTTCIVDVSI